MPTLLPYSLDKKNNKIKLPHLNTSWSLHPYIDPSPGPDLNLWPQAAIGLWAVTGSFIWRFSSSQAPAATYQHISVCSHVFTPAVQHPTRPFEAGFVSREIWARLQLQLGDQRLNEDAEPAWHLTKEDSDTFTSETLKKHNYLCVWGRKIKMFGKKDSPFSVDVLLQEVQSIVEALN